MEVRVADGTGNYASATIMIRSGSNLVVWDTATPTVASLISSSRSFVIYSCATSWLDGTWEAVDTSTGKLTENDRDLTTINGQGDLTGYKLIGNANNATVFTITGHDPADPAHKIFVTPSISGIVAAGDHYHLQKWEPVGGPPVIATQSGYFTAISGGTNTTFTVFASGAGGAVSNFRPWQVGYYLQPNTKKPSYHKILRVTGNTVTVEGNCAALASVGYANHFRVVAPPCVNGSQGGRVYDPVCEESRYLWAGYRYEWPIVGHRLLSTLQPDHNQPGPDGSQTTWDGNALGQYHCWNREYDVLMGRWTTPDPISSEWESLNQYSHCRPPSNTDPSGLLGLDGPLADMPNDQGIFKFVNEDKTRGEVTWGLTGPLPALRGKSSYEYRVDFVPDKSKCRCKEIKFIQFIKSWGTNWGIRRALEIDGINNKSVHYDEKKWMVDTDSDQPYFQNSKTARFGSSDGTSTKTATMGDRPSRNPWVTAGAWAGPAFWWDSLEFEGLSCAVCPLEKRLLGCVHFTIRWSTEGHWWGQDTVPFVTGANLSTWYPKPSDFNDDSTVKEWNRHEAIKIPTMQ